MKKSFKNVWYPTTLKGLEERYDWLLSEFKKLYPLANERNFIDHYIEHFKGFKKPLRNTFTNNQELISHLHNLISNEFDGKIKAELLKELEDAEIEGDKRNIKPLENIYFDYQNVVEWLKEKRKSLKEIPSKENPYPEIFPDTFSFRLFERLHNDYKDSNNLLADFSFIYRKMHSLKHILEYQKPEMFRNWLSKEPYKVVLDNKFKTLDRCRTDKKESNFKTIFDLVSKEHNNVP